MGLSECWLDWEKMYNKYYKAGMTIRQIAETYPISKSRVYRGFKKHGFKIIKRPFYSKLSNRSYATRYERIKVDASWNEMLKMRKCMDFLFDSADKYWMSLYKSGKVKFVANK